MVLPSPFSLALICPVEKSNFSLLKVTKPCQFENYCYDLVLEVQPLAVNDNMEFHFIEPTS